MADLETTILYGIRSGHPKAHNITDVPAFGRLVRSLVRLGTSWFVSRSFI